MYLIASDVMTESRTSITHAKYYKIILKRWIQSLIGTICILWVHTDINSIASCNSIHNCIYITTREVISKYTHKLTGSK